MKKLIISLICYLGVVSNATAQWQLHFTQNALPLTPDNQQVLSQLLPLLKSLPEQNQLVFTFYQSHNADKNWKRLRQYFSQRGVNLQTNYRIEQKKTIASNQLSIHLKLSKDSKQCPGYITVQDTALPIPEKGLSVRHSTTLNISKQAKLSIVTAGDIKNNYYVFAHHPKTNQYRDIRQLQGQQIVPMLSREGEYYYLIAVPNNVNAKTIMQLQKSLNGSRGQYQHLNDAPDLDMISTPTNNKQIQAKRKAAGLNAINFVPQEVVGHSQADKQARRQTLQIQACRLALKPLSAL